MKKVWIDAKVYIYDEIEIPDDKSRDSDYINDAVYNHLEDKGYEIYGIDWGIL